MRYTNQPSGRNLPKILIPASDYDRLADAADAAGNIAPQVADYLARELGRAQVVPDHDFDPAAARVGSRVTYSDDQSGERRTVTLAWPQDADFDRHRISVLTSIGAALLGLRAGQSIDWAAPLGGARTLTVAAVRNDDATPAMAATDRTA
jgi:regulator of nucleoside diphosphate kinase